MKKVLTKNLAHRSKKKAWILLLCVIVMSVAIGAYSYFDLAPIKNKGLSVGPEYPNAQYPSAFRYEAKPGDVISDSLILENNFDVPLELIIYVADKSKEDEEGVFTLRQPPLSQEAVGLWTELELEEAGELTISPGEKKSVSFKITIPPMTKLEEYKGGIGVQYVTQNIKEDNKEIAVVLERILRITLKVTDEPMSIEKYDVEAFRSDLKMKVIARFAIYAILLNGLFIMIGLALNKVRK